MSDSKRIRRKQPEINFNQLDGLLIMILLKEKELNSIMRDLSM